MKLLLDENLPRRLRWMFGEGYEVFTMQNMKWLGKKNGDLLGSMTLRGFDALVTNDQSLPKQQNVARFPIKIFVLNSKSNRLEDIEPKLEKLRKLLQNLPDRQIFEIE